MTNHSDPIRIAILIFPDVTLSTAYGMFDIFMAVGRDWGYLTSGEAGLSPILPALVCARSGPIAAANGVELADPLSVDDFPDPHVVCVPDIAIPPGEPLHGLFDAELEYLRLAYARGATIATACSGALFLAEAGLLNGWQATTHWGYCDYFRKRFPEIEMHPQRALVISGEGQRLVMAGGGTSWLDLALLLIARWCNVEEAMRVARINLIDWHSVGQQPFAHLARSRQVEDAVIADCQVWIAENYQLSAPVALMVQRSRLPERSFKRRFQQATGMSPLEYVHTLRLEEAKQMLECNDLQIEAIANEVGYEDAGFFSRLFRRQVGLTPAAYRKRFGGMRRALAGSEMHLVG
jgi:transcriptional regulator GlxA family with amidase domain